MRLIYLLSLDQMCTANFEQEQITKFYRDYLGEKLHLKIITPPLDIVVA